MTTQDKIKVVAEYMGEPTFVTTWGNELRFQLSQENVTYHTDFNTMIKAWSKVYDECKLPMIKWFPIQVAFHNAINNNDKPSSFNALYDLIVLINENKK